MLPIFHFYHAWADGGWEWPASEHVTAIRESGFKAEAITVGLVGSPERVTAARDWFTEELAFAGPVSFVTAPWGYEQVTLHAVRSFAITRKDEAAVLYAHTKGAMNPTLLTRDWRREMTSHVVTRWDIGAALLCEYDAVGCFWLTPEKYADRLVEAPFFGGNFWWARASYLARLPKPDDTTRYAAERWIGKGNPKICDLRPGYPADLDT
jgi:hypothetical protein